jgi:hypothetical protein
MIRQRVLFVVFSFFSIISPALAQFQLVQSDQGVQVLLNGDMVTEYLTAGPCPILWPLMAADGAGMTRDFPMSSDTPGERRDHPHHRSMWFTHGDVNGIDFWHKGGTVVHQEFLKLQDGEQAVIESVNLWVDGDGNKVLKERRRMSFGSADTMRWVDVDLVLSADFGNVIFGDTKEGSFAVRVAESMKVDARKGGKIMNSEGKSDLLAWGQRAAWVNYTGPVNDKTYGIAMFCHPSSFNYPNRWHVRTYGLFAANPFGERSFTGSQETPEVIKLEPSEQLRLCYRVLLHMGITDKEKLDEIFQEFSEIELTEL